MNRKLSVIVPVYKTAEYLHECIHSILYQDYKQLEVLVIDDGSPDGCAAICDDYALKNVGVIAVHKQNAGLSEARNTGITCSSGWFVTFVDSDDALLMQPYTFLILRMIEKNAHIACMDRYCGSEYPNGESFDSSESVAVYSNVDVYRKLCEQSCSEAAWDKIFVRDIVSKQQFTKDTLNEDFLFMVQICVEPVRVLLTNYVGYFYRQRIGSITASGFKQNMIDALYNAEYAYKNIPDETCRRAAEGYLLHRSLMFLVNMPVSYIYDKNADYLHVIQELKKIPILSSNRSIRDKIVLCCFVIAPKITRKLCGMYITKKEN